MFQSTPPRGGRPLARLAVLFSTVSIHAPARGATKTRPRPHPSTSVSIHAPARGATSAHDPHPNTVRRFNPRPRAGGDSRQGPTPP